MNTFLKGFTKGVADYGTALRFIFKNKLAWAFLVPIILNFLLLAGGLALVSELTEELKLVVSNSLEMESADFWGAEFIRWLIAGSVWLVLKLVFFFLFSYTGGYIVLMLMSPFLAYLSERSERIMTGKSYRFDAEQLMRDIVRAVLIALRNLLAELLIIFAFFILGLLPLVGWVLALAAPFILLLVSAYFYGFSFTDYYIERRRYNVKSSIRFMKTNRGLITGNGLPFALSLLIPFVGLSLSGFMAIVSVVSAVVSLNHLDDNNPETEYRSFLEVGGYGED